MKKEEFILGVNYWPRKKAMYWWRDFDENEVDKEFKEIASYGLNTIRFFLDWEYFQPQPAEINNKAIKNLGKVFDIAKKHKLKTIPTFMTGHMSGVNLVPSWAVDSKKKHLKSWSYTKSKWHPYSVKNIYKDNFMIAAEKFFIKSIVQKFASRKEILMWDINNEPCNLYSPPDATMKRWRDSKTALNWNELMINEIRRYDKKHPITYSAEVYEFYEKRNEGARESDREVISLHYYPQVNWAKTSESGKLVYEQDPPASLGTQKPVLLEEFGAKLRKHRKEFFTEKNIAKLYEDILKRFYKMGAIGAIAWDFTDYDPSLKNTYPFTKLPYEMHFGITRADGSLKPAGKVLIKFAKKLKN